MKKTLTFLGTVAALTLAGASAHAAIPIGTAPGSNPYFFVTGSTPGFTNVAADFGDSFSSSMAFDDVYTFTTPVSGMGSGSVSTSFSSDASELVISSVIINGVAESVAAAGYPGINGVPITAGILNTIEIIGTSGSGLSTYTGTATFTASPVPEPATWAMMLVGLGMIGFAARRRQNLSVSYA